MQGLERTVGRLRHTMVGLQTELILEGAGLHAHLLEDITDGPVGIALDQAIVVGEGLHIEGRLIAGIVIAGTMPLGVVQRQRIRLGLGLTGHLYQDIARVLVDAVHEGLAHGFLLFIRHLIDVRQIKAGALGARAVHAHGGQRIITGVMMGGNEINRNVIIRTELLEGDDPGVDRGGGTTDLQFRIHSLQRAGGHLVQVEVILLGAIEEEAQVRLVPDFEEPLAHLVQTVALDQVLAEQADELLPLVLIIRHAGTALVMEQDRVRGCQIIRHETDLDERLHPDLQQEVKDDVDVVEGDDGLAKSEARLEVDAHVIVEQAMEADVLKTDLIMRFADVGLHVLAQQGRGVAGTHAELPVMRIRTGGCFKIY